MFCKRYFYDLTLMRLIKFGRRSLLLATFPNMMWTLLCAGLCTLLREGSDARLGLVALFVFLFAGEYSAWDIGRVRHG